MISLDRRSLIQTVLVLGLTMGLVGFFINLRPLTLGGGLDFVFGGIVAFVLLRTCNWKSGLVAAAIASSATILLWHHPWAMFIWIAEYIFIARPPVFRKSSSILHSLVFWLFLGLPLVLLSYGWWMAMPLPDAFLVAQKQAANGLVNLAIANSIVVALTWLSAIVSERSSRVRVSWQPLSMHEQVISILVLFVILPLLVELTFKSARLYTGAYNKIAEELHSSTFLMERQFDAWLARQQFVIERIDHYWTSKPHRADAVHLIEHLAEGPISGVSVLCVTHPGQRSPIAVFSSAKHSHPCPPADLDVLRGDVMEIEWHPASASSEAKGMFFLYSFARNSESRNLWTAGFTEEQFRKELLPSGTTAGDINLIFGTAKAAPDARQVHVTSPDAEVLEPFQGISNLTLLGRTLVTPQRLGIPVMMTVAAATFQKSTTLPFAQGWSATVSAHPDEELKDIRRTQSATLSRFVAFGIGAILIAVMIGRASNTVLSDLVAAVPFNLGRVTINRPMSGRIFSEGQKLYDRLELAQQRFADENVENARLRNILIEIARLPPLGIYALDMPASMEVEPTVNFVSPSLLSMIGEDLTPDDYSKAVLLWRDLIHPEDQNRVVGRLRTLPYGSREIVEYRVKSADGKYRWVVDCAVVPQQQAGADDGREIIGTIIDVTDLKLAQQSIVQLSKLSTLGEMAAGLAHEINQPLQTITFAIANLEADLSTFPKTEKSDAVARRLGIIEEQIDRASAIIANVALFGRSSQLQLIPMDSAEIAGSIVNLAIPVCRERGIVFELRKPVASQLVQANKVSVEQVVLNFVTNACDAIEERIASGDLSPGRVEFAVLDEGDWVSFRISDNGTGLPAGNVENLFEPFFTTKPAGKGTGLGLSVAFGIAQEMGGSIHAYDLPAGATFTLDIPKSA